MIDLEPAPDPPKGENLELVSTLIEACEAKHWLSTTPWRPGPGAAIRFNMDNTSMTVADLVPYIGPRHRVCEVLKGERSQTMPMIRRLITLGIPAIRAWWASPSRWPREVAEP